MRRGNSWAMSKRMVKYHSYLKENQHIDKANQPLLMFADEHA